MTDSKEMIVQTDPVDTAKCPHCGTLNSVEGLRAFSKVQCGSCGKAFEVPAMFGHFRLLKLLGHGGMGGVYLGHDEVLDRDTAIKVMQKSYGDNPSFVERFQREAQAAAKLNHPNIAQIYTFGQEKGQPYIAMEFVNGGALDKQMEKSPGKLDVAYVMRVGQQIAAGLSVAAAAGLVHGDVKPENILFSNDGTAKLVDFGLAAMQAESGEIWGTPYYISPEKCKKQKIDFRADMFSLGATLYHAIAGVPPFEGKDSTEVVKARFHGTVKKPSEIRPDVPPEVDAIILRMLAVDPARRHPTYDSLQGDISRFLAKAGPVKDPARPALKIKLKPRVGSQTAFRQPQQGQPEQAPAQAPSIGLSAAEIAVSRARAALDGTDGSARPKGQMNIGAIVAAVVLGVIGVIAIVAVLLWWYVKSTEAANRENVKVDPAELVRAREKAVKSIEGNLANAEKYEKEVSKLCDPAIKLVCDVTADVKALLEPKVRDAVKLIPAPPPALVKSIEESLPEAERKKVEKERAKQPKPVKKVKEVDAAAPEDGGMPEEEKDDKAGQTVPGVEGAVDGFYPPSIPKLEELWRDAYICSNAIVRTRTRIKELESFRTKLNAMSGSSEREVEAMVALASDLSAEIDKIKAMQEIQDARKKAGVIKSKAPATFKAIRREVNKHKEELASAALAVKNAESEKEQKERLEREHRKQVAKELEEIAQAYKPLEQNVLKKNQFDAAEMQLKLLETKVKTIEGKRRLREMIECVGLLRDFKAYLVKESKGVQVRNRRFEGNTAKIEQYTITNATATAVTFVTPGVLKGETSRIVTWNWERVYANAMMMGDLINAIVRPGREKKNLNLKSWSNHMMAAAITLRIHFWDTEKSAANFAMNLIATAVKEFHPCQSKVDIFFPELKGQKLIKKGPDEAD